jgi:hypothetical protein
MVEWSKNSRVCLQQGEKVGESVQGGQGVELALLRELYPVQHRFMT